MDWEKLINDNWINILFFLITTAIAIYQINKERKVIPVLYYKSIPLINEKFSTDGLQFSFGSKKVNKLILVSIVFFNLGNKALKKQDVENRNPIKFIFPEGNEILHINDVYKNPPTSVTKTKICKKKNEIVLDFHFLNQYHGIVSQVLVESENVKNIRVKAEGVIADCKEILVRHDVQTHNRSRFQTFIINYVPVIYIVYGSSMIIQMIEMNNYKQLDTAIVAIICGIVLFSIKNLKKIPKEFNKYIA